MNTENNVKEFPTQQTQIELEDKTYRLEEMVEAMTKSLDNIDTVTKEQSMLIDVILKSDKAADFREFIKNLEQQCDSLKSQKATLSIRRDMLKQVVDACKENEANAKLVTMLVDALAIFQNN